MASERATRSAHPNRVGAVLVAAGRSSRVGTMKQLLDWHGRSILRHLSSVLLDADLDPVVVVLGHEAERLREEIDDLPLRVVVNEDYDRGMFSSVQCGFRALMEEVDACVVALVDQPRIDPDLLRRLVREHMHEGAQVTIPVYAGQTGHPIVVGRNVATASTRTEGNATLRDVLSAFSDLTHHARADGDCILTDIDTLEEYERQLSLSTLEIRPATEEDYAFLKHVHHVALPEVVDATWGWDEAYQDRFFDDHWTSDDTWIIMVKGKAIGMYSVTRENRDLFLASIMFMPEWQGRGFGTHVIRSVLALAAQDKSAVRLRVLKANRARRLYERLGFVVTDETKTHFVMVARPLAR